MDIPMFLNNILKYSKLYLKDVFEEAKLRFRLFLLFFDLDQKPKKCWC